ncbi:hypothetical protein KAFR_0I01280 [Kazachstania africana CBS 2517]|uniref:MIF4G domain-containing protein n=1 Tax=Kazachstania africana (strain ATCC 22294 / BCRC 22015 / CBS 2517 / CECT 1963 / NBRC 1671 / NRRL Y-8276) TaxID=1071382 RepID=H2AZV9_KAZAF|nr:hypothetical protein KAFR_0I01280 [Kazachstania africana CBS 2517]CCF59909.1 hypothetical protein KAFR_0I01280 [Kazachstania africana CBS 2517]
MLEAEAKREAEEKARKEEEEKARLEAEEKAKLEAEEKARLEDKEKARLEAEEKAKQEDASANQEPDGKKVMTFAERMKLKKLQKAKESSEKKESSPAEIPASSNVPTTSELLETPKEETNEVQEEEDSTFVAEEQTKKIAEEEEEIEQASKEEEEVEEEQQNLAETQQDEEVVEAEGVTVSEILQKLNEVQAIENIYDFKYPESFEAPDIRYKKEHIKYTYGPTFLLQFKDNFKAVPDAAWVQSTASKIVIPPGMSRSNRSRDSGKFGGRGDFRSDSNRSDRSRNSSRRSRRDDRRSNRSYRRDRDRSERGEKKDEKAEEKPKEEVAPLVPSANRWVPRSRAKKVETKFAPDGVTELYEKEEVERKMKSLLNKLTLEKFDSISSEILAIANLSKWEQDGVTLKTVIEQIFLKACDEPHWSSMYAQLCGKVVKDLDTEIADESNEGKTGPKLVLHYLVIRCQTEFQKGWTDKLPTNEDGTPLEPEMMSDEYYQAAAAKRRGLGLVRFIGYLYRLHLLTGKMMFECFRKLMKEMTGNPSEEILESVVELLETVGEQFENDRFSAGAGTLEGSALLDSLFSLVQNIVDSGEITNRVKFKLLDVKELREEKGWSSNKKDNGPKTIQQIHEEEERQRSLKRESSRSSSKRSNRGSRRDKERDREPSTVKDKDNFVTTRSFSQRSQQKAPVKEEPTPAAPAASNMFSALMDNSDDEE